MEVVKVVPDNDQAPSEAAVTYDPQRTVLVVACITALYVDLVRNNQHGERSV